ncbi:signal transduction histidine kinase [Phyllobacterium trifolii]|uniref:Signal transduction histidine kinase n=1 Tax=Phyllobacterium trifolii TaxID=300193 RepID=A0A839UGT7_9HYPH|nr:HAMP domain-containing sensor histidine kinase [Phyllobacterium trifolii]MBB3147739.1 signal transduction histidine kinase [Phyllobacterium trifolii]
MSSIDSVLRYLRSENPSERLKAARFLANNARATEATPIREALARETVVWIRGALQRALERCVPAQAASSSSTIDRDDFSADFAAQVHAEALETTTAQLLHEVEPLVGSLKLAAQGDVANYETSLTKTVVDRLDNLLEALSRLRRAASAPKIEEFDLSVFLGEVLSELDQLPPIVVQRAGPDHLIVVGDKTLLRMCVLNGLRNAVDATNALVDEIEEAPLTIAWGSTNKEAWISIVDLGIGFGGNLQRAFDIGTTTKEGHLGMGLAITQQSIKSMSGRVALIPNPRGTRFELRWPLAREA